MRSTLCIVILGLSIVNAFQSTNVEATAPQIGEQVETTSGSVKGHEAQWPKNSGVSEYLGIPFAEPPLGQLRFAAPTTYKPRGPISGADFVSIFNTKHFLCLRSFSKLLRHRKRN
jgi:hypothetical protein